MYRLVERERHRKWEAERGALTHRIGQLGARFEPGSPVVRTVASTHEVDALPTELNTATRITIFRRKRLHKSKNFV